MFLTYTVKFLYSLFHLKQKWPKFCFYYNFRKECLFIMIDKPKCSIFGDFYMDVILFKIKLKYYRFEKNTAIF